MLLQRNSNCPPLASVNNCCVPLYGTSHDVDAGFLLQRLEHQVRRGADARMAECGLALLSAAGFEQLRQCPGVRRVRCHHHRGDPPSMEMGSKSVRG